jgi:hypothetical protein
MPEVVEAETYTKVPSGTPREATDTLTFNHDKLG